MTDAIGWLPVLARLGSAVVLGGIIGIEREIHGKVAGLRTHILVALGAALFTVISVALPMALEMDGPKDPTRIAAQIITGVGFLGAGTILHSRGSVHGLTTAASIWLVAAIGMAAGGGFFLLALLTTGLGHLVLVVLHRLEAWLHRRKGGLVRVTVRLRGSGDIPWAEGMADRVVTRPFRWKVTRGSRGIRMRLEGRLSPEEVQAFQNAVHEQEGVRSYRVERI